MAAQAAAGVVARAAIGAAARSSARGGGKSAVLKVSQTVSQKRGRRKSSRSESKKRQKETEDRGKKLDEINNWDIAFGINNNLRYYKGRKKPVRVAKVFLWGEFGTRDQRARPAVSDMWKRKKRKYDSAYQTMVAVYLLPRYKPGGWRSRLERYGKGIVFDIKNAIEAYRKIPNTDSTKKRKQAQGFDPNNPLIATRKMKNAWEARVYKRQNKRDARRNFRDLGKAMREFEDKINAQDSKR